jgi:ribulose-bisphosphate carboxylase large chain
MMSITVSASQLTGNQMSSERIRATYFIETPFDPKQAAIAMAGEQSSGTFLTVPGETPELKQRSAARVEDIVILGSKSRPSLPGARVDPDMPVTQAHVTLSWPLDNIGTDIINLFATVAGNLFELHQFTGLRLLDITLPVEFSNAYHGPKFGIAGTRRLSGVDVGPLIGTIIKPSVGLTAQETADMVATLAAANIDFIKDDELQSNGPACPFEDRARAVMRAIDIHADKTGKKVMYAFNITGTHDDMRRRHDLVRALGGTCVMASVNSVGLTGLLGLSEHSELPIHAHRNGWGYLSRCPVLGFDYTAWSKFWRLAGVDHMHVNGLQNKFSEPDASVIKSAKSMTTPLFDTKEFAVMPVFSSGQSVIQVGQTYAELGHADVIYAAGGGIMGHPMGPAAGVRALRDAWDAALQGVSAEVFANHSPELRAALSAFGK